jgi:hypothetical protein
MSITGTNTVSPVVQNENEAGTSQLPSSPDNIIRGAEGGAPRVDEANDDITILKEVESCMYHVPLSNLCVIILIQYLKTYKT